MHEYSLATGLLRMIDRQVREAGATRVLAVHLRIGAAAGVEIDLLETAFENLRAGGPCADARLVVERVPTRWACALCREPVPDGGPLRCPSCDVAAVLESGDEILLQRLELERA